MPGGVEKGRPWERPGSAPPDRLVDGDDAALAAAVRDHPGARIGFRPDPRSDLARALGVHTSDVGPSDGAIELALDALRIVADDRELFAVNMVVLGTPPDRTCWWTRAPHLRVTVGGRVVHDGGATGVVVANGQFLRGHDVVPRGHPGDGRLEVQVYAVPRGQRAGVRDRLPQGVHLPHPGIGQAVGREVEVVASRARLQLEVDGTSLSVATRIAVELVPQAYLLVV